MDWIQVNRLAYKLGIVALATVATVGGTYLVGYPWTCEQAIKTRNLAYLRLRRAQNEYPPGTPYRQYREAGQQYADTLVKGKCKTDGASTQNSETLKFFLKYRSDY